MKPSQHASERRKARTPGAAQRTLGKQLKLVEGRVNDSGTLLRACTQVFPDFFDVVAENSTAV